MIREVFLGLQQLLQNPWYDKQWETSDEGFNDDENNVWEVEDDPELTSVAWHLGQDKQNGDIHQLESQTAYFKFNKADMKDLGNYIQSGILTFDVILISQTGYGDDRDITDTKYIDHSAVLTTIYKRLSGQRVLNDNVELLSAITRTKIVFPHQINNLMKSVISFQARIVDYSACDLEHNEIPPISFDTPTQLCPIGSEVVINN